MSEHLDGLFERLRGTPPPEPFPPAAAVRRRGRQRTARQAASIGFAALLVTGLGAASLVTVTDQPDRPESSPVPPATALAVTEIPDSWLLAATDLGPGTWQQPESDHFEFGGYPWIWASRCGYDGSEAELEAAYPSLRQRRDIKLVEWQNAELQAADPGWRVLGIVELFEASAAVANLSDVEQAIDACESVVWRVVDRNFAGEQAVFVEEQLAGITAYYAVVKVGAAVATIRATDAQLVRDLAPRAATRLR